MLFCVILIPVTLVFISNNLLHIVQNEANPYSYFIFKTDALKKDIESLEASVVCKLYGPGTPVNETIDYITNWVKKNRR